MCKYLMGQCEEGGTRVFSVFSAAHRKEEGPWEQMKTWEIPYNSNNVQGFLDSEDS